MAASTTTHFLCWSFTAQSTSSAISLPNHAFTGQAKSSKRLTSIVHILSLETDNCPSWIIGRERNDRRNYFIINLQEKNLAGQVGIEPVTWSPLRCVSDWATDAGTFSVKQLCCIPIKMYILYRKMTKENISWLISMKECCQPGAS